MRGWAAWPALASMQEAAHIGTYGRQRLEGVAGHDGVVGEGCLAWTPARDSCRKPCLVSALLGEVLEGSS